MGIRLGIKFKLTLAALLLVAATISVLTSFTAYIAYQRSEQQARRLMQEVTQHYAYQMKSRLEEALDEARSLARFIEGLVHSGQALPSREQINGAYRHYIEQTPNLVGISLIFEPNAFDGKDAEYANQVGHDASGRFVPYWTRDPQGQGNLEALLDYATAEYYTVPKNARKAALIEPYVYPIQGRDVVMTSLMAPIYDKSQQEVIGMVGFDIELSELQTLAEHLSVEDYQSAYLHFISRKGQVVASGNANYLMRHVSQITDSREMIQAVLQGRTAFVRRTSRTLGRVVISYVTPVQVDHTDDYWVVTLSVSRQEVHAQIDRLLRLMLYVSGGVLLLFLVPAFLLAQRLARPLLQINQQLQNLALGKVGEHPPLDYRGEDEVREIIRASERLHGNMQQTIEQANNIAAGHFDQNICLLSEHDQLGHALLNMTQSLRDAKQRNAAADWLKTGQAELALKMSGDQSLAELAEHVISFLCTYLQAHSGLFYLLVDRGGQSPHLELLASYALDHRRQMSQRFELGEGVVGQAALEAKPILLTEVPPHYTRIVSGSGNAVPTQVHALPFIYEGEVKGVIELGALKPFNEVALEFLRQAMPTLAIAVNTAQSRAYMQQLLNAR